MKIYTKTGDKGQTSLLGGHRVAKDDLRLQTYGTIDEINSHIGLLQSFIQKDKDQNQTHSVLGILTHIQNDLFLLGSHIACKEDADRVRYKLQSFEVSKSEFLESNIDLMEQNLPPLKNFILPGGSLASSQAHICRTVCRRAERHMVTLNESNTAGLIYLNRLSDYFFTLARYLNHLQKIEDVPWIPRP